jgi:hypothetical protein
LLENIYEFIEWRIETWAKEDRKVRDKFLEAQHDVTGIENDLRQIESDIEEIKDDLDNTDPGMRKEIQDMKEELTEKEQNREFVKNSVLAPAKKELAASKKEFNKHWDDRKLSDTRLKLDNDIYVDKFKLISKPYHGGKVDGNDARKIMEKRDELCEAIQELLLHVVANQHDDNKKEEIKDYLKLVHKYLAQLSNLFSRLRKFHGTVTEDDFKQMEMSAGLLVKLARELNLRYTPSMHILHKHAVALCKKHKGFGELLEDLIEQMHQVMGRLHRRFAGMGSCRERAKAMSKAIEITQNPGVQESIKRVEADRKRNYKEPQKMQANQEAAKQDRKKRREEEVEQEISREEGPQLNFMQKTMEELNANKSKK